MSEPAAEPAPPSRVARWLTEPRLPVALALVAVVLSTPAYFADYQIDDWVHQARLRGDDILPNRIHSTLELFSFMDGTEAFHSYAVADGSAPWYTSPDMLVSLLRPVSAATHWFDHAVAPGVPLVAHLHNVLWFLLVVVLATFLFRSVYRDRAGPAALIAGVAALAYAVDEAHGLPVAWIANRNGIITCAIGIAILLLHRRAVRAGRWPVLAIALLPVGLLSGEAALAVTAYLFAHAVFLEEGSPRRRLLRLTPYAAVVVVWRVIYSWFGYGTRGSGLYIDPAREPLQYASALVQRLPLLLGDQWAGVPSLQINFFDPVPRLVAVTVAVVLVVGIGWLLWRRLRSSPTARFWALGMVLSALPVCATFPSNRLLWFVGLGGAGLLAEFVVGAWDAEGRLDRWSARALVAFHIAFAPVAFVANAATMGFMADYMFETCEKVVPNEPAVVGKTAIFVNSNALCVGHARVIRSVQGGHLWSSSILMASAVVDVEVIGIDDHTVEIRPDGGYHRHPPDQLFRSGEDPMDLGAQVKLTAATVTITEHNDDGYVSAARFRFDVPLRDPSLIWLKYEELELLPFTPPGPGERRRIRTPLRLR
jgi:hypothetical protein